MLPRAFPVPGSVVCAVCVYSLVCVSVCDDDDGGAGAGTGLGGSDRDEGRIHGPLPPRATGRSASDRVIDARVCVRERASGLRAFSLLAASAAGALKLQHTHSLRLRPQHNNNRKTAFRRGQIEQHRADNADSNFGLLDHKLQKQRRQTAATCCCLTHFLKLPSASSRLRANDRERKVRGVKFAVHVDTCVKPYTLIYTLSLSHTHTHTLV